eukprot:g12615.t1
MPGRFQSVADEALFDEIDALLAEEPAEKRRRVQAERDAAKGRRELLPAGRAGKELLKAAEKKEKDKERERKAAADEKQQEQGLLGEAGHNGPGMATWGETTAVTQAVQQERQTKRNAATTAKKREKTSGSKQVKAGPTTRKKHATTAAAKAPHAAKEAGVVAAATSALGNKKRKNKKQASAEAEEDFISEDEYFAGLTPAPFLQCNASVGAFVHTAGTPYFLDPENEFEMEQFPSAAQTPALGVEGFLAEEHDEVIDEIIQVGIAPVRDEQAMAPGANGTVVDGSLLRPGGNSALEASLNPLSKMKAQLPKKKETFSDKLVAQIRQEEEIVLHELAERKQKLQKAAARRAAFHLQQASLKNHKGLSLAERQQILASSAVVLMGGKTKNGQDQHGGGGGEADGDGALAGALVKEDLEKSNFLGAGKFRPGGHQEVFHGLREDFTNTNSTQQKKEVFPGSGPASSSTSGNLQAVLAKFGIRDDLDGDDREDFASAYGSDSQSSEEDERSAEVEGHKKTQKKPKTRKVRVIREEEDSSGLRGVKWVYEKKAWRVTHLQGGRKLEQDFLMESFKALSGSCSSSVRGNSGCTNRTSLEEQEQVAKERALDAALAFKRQLLELRLKHIERIRKAHEETGNFADWRKRWNLPALRQSGYPGVSWHQTASGKISNKDAEPERASGDEERLMENDGMDGLTGIEFEGDGINVDEGRGRGPLYFPAHENRKPNTATAKSKTSNHLVVASEQQAEQLAAVDKMKTAKNNQGHWTATFSMSKGKKWTQVFAPKIDWGNEFDAEKIDAEIDRAREQAIRWRIGMEKRFLIYVYRMDPALKKQFSSEAADRGVRDEDESYPAGEDGMEDDPDFSGKAGAALDLGLEDFDEKENVEKNVKPSSEAPKIQLTKKAVEEKRREKKKQELVKEVEITKANEKLMSKWVHWEWADRRRQKVRCAENGRLLPVDAGFFRARIRKRNGIVLLDEKFYPEILKGTNTNTTTQGVEEQVEGEGATPATPATTTYTAADLDEAQKKAAQRVREVQRVYEWKPLMGVRGGKKRGPGTRGDGGKELDLELDLDSGSNSCEEDAEDEAVEAAPSDPKQRRDRAAPGAGGRGKAGKQAKPLAGKKAKNQKRLLAVLRKMEKEEKQKQKQFRKESGDPEAEADGEDPGEADAIEGGHHTSLPDREDDAPDEGCTLEDFFGEELPCEDEMKDRFGDLFDDVDMLEVADDSGPQPMEVDEDSALCPNDGRRLLPLSSDPDDTKSFGSRPKKFRHQRNPETGCFDLRVGADLN